MGDPGRHAVPGDGGAPWPIRAVALVRGLWGAVLLARPRTLVVLQPGLGDSAAAARVVRVLGGRHVGQAALTTARSSRWVCLLGATADLLHAVTALLYAGSGQSRRRVGLSSAGVAAGLGVATLLAARPHATRDDPPPLPARSPQPPRSTGSAASAGPAVAVAETQGEAGEPARHPEHVTRKPPRHGASDESSKKTLVRPRTMWIGVAVAILGMAFIAAGMVLVWGWWVWAGAGVLLVGLLVAWRGGALNDVHSGQALSQELHEAAQGGTHHGVAAGEQIRDREAREHASATTVRTERLLASRTGTSAPVRPAATAILLVLGAWIFVATFMIPHPYTIVGQNSALRDLGFAIVVLLSALWLRHVGRSRAVSGIVVLAGLLMVLSAFLLPYVNPAVAVDDGVTGGLVILAGMLGAVGTRAAD